MGIMRMIGAKTQIKQFKSSTNWTVIKIVINLEKSLSKHSLLRVQPHCGEYIPLLTTSAKSRWKFENMRYMNKIGLLSVFFSKKKKHPTIQFQLKQLHHAAQQIRAIGHIPRVFIAMMRQQWTTDKLGVGAPRTRQQIYESVRCMTNILFMTFSSFSNW